MRNISVLLSVLALIGVGVLFYLQFSSKEKKQRPVATDNAASKGDFKMAYFDIDSLQDKYQYFKDVSSEIKNKESNITAQLNTLQESFQKRLKELQDKSATMTQAEGEAAQKEYMQMQQKYQQRQMALEQDLKKQQLDMMTSVRSKIENYLKQYNKDRGYAFILSYEPGLMLYYRDSLYDITNEVINGLNAEYKKEKK